MSSSVAANKTWKLLPGTCLTYAQDKYQSLNFAQLNKAGQTKFQFQMSAILDKFKCNLKGICLTMFIYIYFSQNSMNCSFYLWWCILQHSKVKTNLLQIVFKFEQTQHFKCLQGSTAVSNSKSQWLNGKKFASTMPAPDTNARQEPKIRSGQVRVVRMVRMAWEVGKLPTVGQNRGPYATRSWWQGLSADTGSTPKLC